MKLIVRIMVPYLLLSMIVFVIGGVISYEVMKREIDLEQRRFLKERLDHAIRLTAKKQPDRPYVRNKLKVIPLKGNVRETPITYSDTLMMHTDLQRMEPHIKLDVVKRIEGRYYHISMYDLIIEADDVEEAVREAMVIMYALLFVLVLVISWISSKWLLKPFHTTLYKIKQFNLKDTTPSSFPATNTEEFRKLNTFLEEMTRKVRRDYQSLKEFTENASHEMQTPLSIANGKLELLLASERLNNDEVALVVSAQESIRRISKLSKSLSLLTKIENQEFDDIQEVNLTEEVQKLLYDFNELIDLKGIHLFPEIAGKVTVNIDPVLAAILVTNLLQNAIRHNVEYGNIWLKLTPEKLVISNTGRHLSASPEKLFNRFSKDNQSKESLGLGLAIVKKICDASGFGITYHYNEGLHAVVLDLKKS